MNAPHHTHGMAPDNDSKAAAKTLPRRGGAIGLGRVFGILAAVVGIGFLALRSEVGQTLFGGWSFVKSIARDQGTYYRLKVKLTYKGEPQDFNIVVGCNVRRITYKDGSGTYEAGLIPTVFGRRMSDGKGLVVRPPNACKGQTTANGSVEPDLLPIVVVYDDADTLDFGVAYLSEDAYDSPVSVLKFGGATIESARRSDFDGFRRTQPNLVKRESYWSALAGSEVLKRMNIAQVTKPWAHECEGYSRYQIPKDLRPLVQQHWPDDKPHYWISDTYDTERDLARAMSNSTLLQTDRPSDAARKPGSFGPVSQHEADFAMPTRTGGGFVDRGIGRFFPQAYFPAASDLRLEYSSPDGSFAQTDLDIQGGRARGFAYCFVRTFPSNTDTTGRLLLARVDGEEVTHGHQSLGPPGWIFERDEYALVFFRINLESTRGDV